MIQKIKILLFLIFILSITDLLANEPISIRIEQVEAKSDSLINELIRVEGNVYVHINDPKQTTHLYQLRGDFGGIIYVRTTKQLPANNSRITVCGYLQQGDVYLVDSNYASRGYFIAETSCGVDDRLNQVMVTFNTTPTNARIKLNGRLIGNSPVSHSLNRNTPNQLAIEKFGFKSATLNNYSVSGNSTFQHQLEHDYILFAGLGMGALVLAFGIIGLVNFSRQKRMNDNNYRYNTGHKHRSEPFTVPINDYEYAERKQATTVSDTPTTTVVDTPTVKIQTESSMTQKILKHKLLVLDGVDGLPEIQFQIAANQESAVYTIGRNPGTGPNYIQLKHDTVSRTQATIEVTKAEQYTITNMANEMRNPTKINGRHMVMNESHVLAEGDEIVMGVVKLRFA